MFFKAWQLKTPMTQDDPTPPAEKGEYIELQQLLKLTNLAETGGQAKVLIQGGEVKVNGLVETRRRRKLYVGDTVEVFGQVVDVIWEEDEE
jgi:ribosome-associated protein